MDLRSYRQHFLLTRYLLRAHAGPFLFSVATLMFLFVLQFVMKFIDQLVGKGLTPWVITEFVILNLSWMLVLAVPMSVLVATLMAFGDLSSKNEITAFKAGGASIYRMMLPVLLTSAVIAVGLVLFNNHVLPESNHRLKALTIDIRRKKPTLTLNAGIFSQDISGYSILVRKTFEKTNDLEGITLYDYTDPSLNVTITAETGRISFSPDYRKLVMDLWNGEIHELDLTKMWSYRRIRFTTHRIVMDVQGFDFERSSESFISRGDREMSAQAMRLIVDSLDNVKNVLEQTIRTAMDRNARLLLNGAVDTTVPPFSGIQRAEPAGMLALTRGRLMNSDLTSNLFRLESLDRELDQYLVEIYKKYSIPAACLVFVLVGAPLGIMARRGGFGIAATLSLGFFVLYWACLIGGEKLADRDILSPFFGMWSANIIIGALGILLTIRIGRETVVINWDFLQKYIPRRWRTRLEGEAAEQA